MPVLHRLLVGLLVVALMQFGMVATAPAHAHDPANGLGTEEFMIAHVDVEFDHHFYGEPAGHHEIDAPLGDLPKSSGEPSSHGEHAHVHGCPQLAPTSSSVIMTAPLTALATHWPLITSAAVTDVSFPPHRPPRLIL